MAWVAPKTDWAAADVPIADDFNRAEGNTYEIELGTRTLDDDVAIGEGYQTEGALRGLIDVFCTQLKNIVGTSSWIGYPIGSIKKHSYTGGSFEIDFAGFATADLKITFYYQHYQSSVNDPGLINRVKIHAYEHTGTSNAATFQSAAGAWPAELRCDNPIILNFPVINNGATLMGGITIATDGQATMGIVRADSTGNYRTFLDPGDFTNSGLKGVRAFSVGYAQVLTP